jgi:hypothetical protein
MRSNLKVFKVILSIFFFISLVSCSTPIEPNVIGISSNKDVDAQFAFENRIYSIEGNVTAAEKIKQEVGKVEKIVEEIKENGQANLFTSKVNLTAETKIYTIKNVDKDTVVAVKIDDTYYTAIFAKKLD